MRRTPSAPRISRLTRRCRWIAGVALTAAVAVTAYLVSSPADDLPDEVANAFYLRNLPPDRWVKYHEEKPTGWSRQRHAGLAFDTRRGSLLIFGSDTHGENWDNSVHEFHPLRRRWETHYAPAAPETYRADGNGRPVAGSDALLRCYRGRCTPTTRSHTTRSSMRWS